MYHLPTYNTNGVSKRLCQTARAQYLAFAFRKYGIISDVINLNNYNTQASIVTPLCNKVSCRYIDLRYENENYVRNFLG